MDELLVLAALGPIYLGLLGVLLVLRLRAVRRRAEARAKC